LTLDTAEDEEEEEEQKQQKAANGRCRQKPVRMISLAANFQMDFRVVVVVVVAATDRQT